jgi:hypothetical protein
MFNEESLLLTFQYLAFIFLLPPLVILVIDRIIQYLARDSFAVYSATGIVGTPIHELSHAAACVMFGMRVIELKLYSPNRETGVLGYCNFAYRPSSTLHAVGLVVQGVAPLLAGYLIFLMMPWGNAPETVLTALELTDSSPTYKHALAGASALLVGNLVDGARGFLWCVVALVIGLHAIPSWADIRIAVKGMFTLLALAIGFSALSQIDLSFVPPGIRDAIYAILGLILKGFFWTLEQMTYAVTLVTTVAVAGVVVFLLIPALIVKSYRQVTGKPAPAPFAQGQQVQGAAQVQADPNSAVLQAIGAMVVAQQAGQRNPPQSQAIASHRDTNLTGGPDGHNRPY